MGWASNGSRSPGLAAILAATGAPTYRQLDRWARLGLLRPEIVPSTADNGRDGWRWPEPEQRVAIAMGRCVAAGLTPEAAEKVARAPRGGPVVLGPGVIISLFPLALANEAVA